MMTLRRTFRGARPVAMVAVVLAIVGAASWAGAAPNPAPSDPQHADFHAGNVVSCSQIGLASSTTLFADGDSALSGAVTGTVQAHSGGGEEGNITAVASGVVIDAIVVKGGPAYNVYLPDPPGSGTLSGSHVFPTYPGPYIAPLNPGGNVPTFSHWFVCYHGGDVPTPPQPPGPGNLDVSKVVVNPGGATLPANYTVQITCDDGTNVTRTLPANGGSAIEGPVTGIEANSLCNVSETAVTNATPTYAPTAAGPGGAGIEITSGQTVTVTVTNTFTAVSPEDVSTPTDTPAPAAAVTVQPGFTG
jgi:hypothetical protein